MHAHGSAVWLLSGAWFLGCDEQAPRDLALSNAPPGTLLEVWGENVSLDDEWIEPSAGWPTYSDVAARDGWRNSAGFLCDDSVRADVLDVWADARGVFVMVSEMCNRSVLDTTCTGKYATSVWLNAGEGWSRFLERDPSVESYELIGQEGGRLWLWGPDCGAFAVDETGVGTCFQDVEPWLVFGGLWVDGERVFVLGADDVRVVEGTEISVWSKVPPGALAIFARDDWALLGASNAAHVASDPVPEFEALPVPPAGEYVASFGRAPDDLWLGSLAGWLVHFNGSRWSSFPLGELGGVVDLWGTEDVLYFLSTGGFGRIQDGAPEVLFRLDATAPVSAFSGMWGRAANEVFLVGRDARSPEQDATCSQVVSFYYDGEHVHAF